MDFLIDYWYILIAGVAVIAAIVVFIVDFFKRPSSQQIANLKEWLRWAVTEAEKAMGTGTGQLKLRYVYDLAVKQFPWISVFVSFEKFTGYVDEALAWMKEQLSENKNIEAYIEGI